MEVGGGLVCAVPVRMTGSGKIARANGRWPIPHAQIQAKRAKERPKATIKDGFLAAAPMALIIFSVLSKFFLTFASATLIIRLDKVLNLSNLYFFALFGAKGGENPWD